MERIAKPLSIAIVGFGTVGRAVARIICDEGHSALRLKYVFNRNVESKRVDWLPSDVIWTDDFDLVLSSEVDVIVELIGGLEPAADWISMALTSGKAVVTANKQVIAHRGKNLLKLANANGRQLCFEAAVAGGVPIIHGLQEGLAGDSLYRVTGILNGTCNFILTKMEREKVSFDSALMEAQSLGFAESDPTADVDGFDAQAKLSILSAVGLNCQIDTAAIPLRSVRNVEAIDFAYAHRLNCTIRQISRAELSLDHKDAIFASVQPMLVPLTSSLAQVEGSRNVVVVEGRFGGETAFSGFGAGGDPTGTAVVSDLEAIARTGFVGPAIAKRNEATKVLTSFVSSHYIRFVVADRPGILATLARTFSEQSINIDAVFQEPGCSKDELPFVVTLEECASTIVEKALHESAKLDFNVRPPLWMPFLLTGDSRQ